MKALVLYHANCKDGFGAAWAFRNLAAPSYSHVEYIAVNYQEPMPVVTGAAETDLFILDFSYHIAQLIEATRLFHYVTLIDHHEGMRAELCALRDSVSRPGNITIIFDLEKSGALLSWEYFSPYTTFCYAPPALISHISDYDLWQFKHQDTKAYIAGLDSYPKDFKVWDDIDAGIIPVVREGYVILKNKSQQLEAILASGTHEIYINGNKGLACNAPGIFASDLGNMLAAKSGTYGCTYFTDSEGKIKYSLRSLGDYDVIPLAKHYGGGGHKNAAGFSANYSEDVRLLYSFFSKS